MIEGENEQMSLIPCVVTGAVAKIMLIAQGKGRAV